MSIEDAETALAHVREERRLLIEEEQAFLAQMKSRKRENRDRLITAEQALIDAQRAANPVDESLTQTVGG